jgi:general secretion pathway protein C
MKYLPLASALGLCALACASTVYWGLPWFQPAPAPAAAAARTGPAPPAIEAAAALFGGAPGAAPAIAFKLKGVIEDGADSVAILAEEGKPALAVGVGKEVAPGVIVQEVHQRYVLLVDGGTVKRLDLPDSPIAGLELVAGAPADPSAARAPAVAARAHVAVAKSGGAMPLPIMNPAIANTQGKTPEQLLQMQQAEQMRQVQRFQEMQRAHRPPPPGIGPAAFGAKPVS